MDCHKVDLIESLQRSFFKVRKVRIMVFRYFLAIISKTVCQFFFFACSFLGMILINYQEMDLI